MIVRRATLLAGLLLLGTAGLGAASRIEADPHELYERAREQMAAGHLPEAAAALSRLHSLIVDRPDWDPEGVFANELLPPLRDRLKRLERAAGRLDDFTEQALQGQKPPDLKDDLSTVKDYTAWATMVIQRLRTERDGILDAALPDPEERALMTRTGSYARTERLLQTEVLERMADQSGDDILGLLSGDPQLESVLVRFRQLKQELMQSVAERDRLEQRVRESDQRDRALVHALAAAITDDASLLDPQAGGKPVNLGDRFARFLDGETEALRDHAGQTSPERDLLLTRLARYRKYNQVLVTAGLGSDQGERIEALAQAVARIPIQDGPGPPALPGGVPRWIVAALALCAGFLAGLGFARGGRSAASSGPAGTVRHLVVPKDDPGRTRRDAA